MEDGVAGGGSIPLPHLVHPYVIPPSVLGSRDYLDASGHMSHHGSGIELPDTIADGDIGSAVVSEPQRRLKTNSVSVYVCNRHLLVLPRRTKTRR